MSTSERKATPATFDVLEMQARFEPDEPEVQAEIDGSISDERALAIRRLADASCQVLAMSDLQLAFGASAARVA